MGQPMGRSIGGMGRIITNLLIGWWLAGTVGLWGGSTARYRWEHGWLGFGGHEMGRERPEHGCDFKRIGFGRGMNYQARGDLNRN